MPSSQASTGGNGARGEYARSAQTRERILAATLRVAGEVGLKATSVARIAEAAGVGPGNLYYHFPSRNDLLEKAASWVFEQLLRGIARATEGVEGYFAREEASFRAYLAFVRRNPGYIRLAEERRFHFQEQYDAGVEVLLDALRGELRAAVERDDVRAIDAEEIDRLAHLLLGARYYVDLLAEKQGGASDDALVATYMHLVESGLAAAYRPRERSTP